MARPGAQTGRRGVRHTVRYENDDPRVEMTFRAEMTLVTVWFPAASDAARPAAILWLPGRESLEMVARSCIDDGEGDDEDDVEEGDGSRLPHPPPPAARVAAAVAGGGRIAASEPHLPLTLPLRGSGPGQVCSAGFICMQVSTTMIVRTAVEVCRRGCGGR